MHTPDAINVSGLPEQIMVSGAANSQERVLTCYDYLLGISNCDRGLKSSEIQMAEYFF